MYSFSCVHLLQESQSIHVTPAVNACILYKCPSNLGTPSELCLKLQSDLESQVIHDGLTADNPVSFTSILPNCREWTPLAGRVGLGHYSHLLSQNQHQFFQSALCLPSWRWFTLQDNAAW